MLPKPVTRVLSVRLTRRLCHAEVDDLWHRPAVVDGDQHVRRLEIAVDDPFLMRVLDRLADGDEEIQSLAGREVMLVTVAGDRHAADQVHDEVGPAGVGRASIEYAGDIGMVHQGQRLPFGLEAGNDLPGVHSRLD